jgi:CheY-like chemotaxis protein
MPEMNGVALARQIKLDPGLYETALIMLTSVWQRGDTSALKEIGFSRHITKPVKTFALYDSIVKALDMPGIPPEKGTDPGLISSDLGEERRRGLRILLAEDNVVNQKVALRVLERLGYQADVVSNGKEAVEALRIMPYDVVLMDVQMPEMDGLEATKIIRDPLARVHNPNVPIIAMTAHAMKGDRERCLNAGMDDYVSKPVRPKVLFEVINRQIATDSRSSTLAERTTIEEKVIFDKQDLLEQLDGDEEFFNELLLTFLQEIPARIGELRSALERNDPNSITEQAHTIKGASANIGAHALKQVALEIEVAGKSRDLHKAHSYSEKLEREYSLLKSVLLNSKF